MKTKLPSKRYRIVAVIFSFFVFVHLAFSLQKILTSLAPDFSIFYYSTVDFMRGINPYTDIHLYTVYNYPPLTNTLYLPLVLLPYHVSQALFIMLSFISVFIIVYFSMKLSQLKLNFEMYITVVSLVLLSFPTKFTLTLGQINLIILLLITTAFYFFKKNKDMHSGIFLGIATLIKIFPCFLILFFIKEKKWKTVFSFIITVGVGIGLTLLFFSPSLIISYFESVAGNLFLQGGEMSYFDQSLNSFLLRLSVASDVRLLLRIIFTLTSVFLFLIAKNKSLSYFGLIFSVLLFLPSFAWFHHYVILIPLLIILWTTTTQPTDKLFLIFVCLLTTFHLRAPEAFSSSNIFLFSHPFIGAYILWLFSIKKQKE